MNHQTPPQNQNEHENGLRMILKRIGKGMLKNWGTKLTALLIAIVLWATLIAQDPSLTREKVFEDVTISVTGEDTMKRNGYIVVSDLDKVTGGAYLRVEVPQLQYDTVTSSPFNARIDLSRIKTTGKQTLNVSTTNTSMYGSVLEVEPSSVQITVEEYVTRYRIPVKVTIEGAMPEGYYATTPSVDPPMIAVSGPKSLVESIVRAEAVLDLSQLPAEEGVMRTAVPIILQDANGKPINSKLLEATSESVLLDSIILEQTIYAQRQIAVSDIALVTGVPAKGYVIKAVTVTPSNIIAAGYSDSPNMIDTLYASAPVSVEGATESFTQRVSVRKPSELAYLSADSVTVAVEIGPAITSKTYERQSVSVTNLTDGLKASMHVNRVNITITGPMLWIDALRTSRLELTVDASNLPAGSYELPVLCTITDSAGVSYSVDIAPAFIQVDIREK